MITLTIEAKDGADLRAQLNALLGSSAAVRLASELTTDVAEQIAIQLKAQREGGETSDALAAQASQIDKVTKKRGRPRKDPEPSEPSQVGMEPQGSEPVDTAGVKTPANATPLSDALSDAPVDNGENPDPQKVKDEVLPTLRDLFVSGQVKQVRAILDKFGNGAKSIPEIDAAQFPAIKEFLASQVN